MTDRERNKTYTVGSIHSRVEKFLKKQTKDVRTIVQQALDAICADPFRNPAHIKHMKGPILCSYHWRTDDIRILYEVNTETGEIHIFDAGYRSAIYRLRR